MRVQFFTIGNRHPFYGFQKLRMLDFNPCPNLALISVSTTGNRSAGEEVFSLEKLPFIDAFLIIETGRLPSPTKTNRIASKRSFKRLLPLAGRLYQSSVNVPLQGIKTNLA